MVLHIHGETVLVLQGVCQRPEGHHVIHPDQMRWRWRRWQCHITECQAAIQNNCITIRHAHGEAREADNAQARQNILQQ